MIETREATDDETAAWSTGWLTRIQDRYAGFGTSEEWIASRIKRQADLPDGVTRRTYVLMDGDELAGYVTLSSSSFGASPITSVVDIWVTPERRRRGIATAVRQWAEEHARSAGRSLYVMIDPADEASSALFRAYPVRFQVMMKRLVAPGRLASGVAGRPMTDAEFDAWREASVQGYAAEMVDSGVLSPDEAMEQSQRQFDELLPDRLATSDHTFWALDAGGDQVATNWLKHRYEPGVSFVYGVEVDAEHRGHGYGRAAMIVGEQASLDAGDTHLALNVFGHNEVAINLYSGMGYQIVEQGRSIDAS